MPFGLLRDSAGGSLVFDCEQEPGERATRCEQQPETFMKNTAGFMKKKGHAFPFSWQRRWFIFDHATRVLQYGETEVSAQRHPLGTLTVESARCAGGLLVDVNATSREKGRYTLHLDVPSAARAQVWLGAFQSQPSQQQQVLSQRGAALLVTGLQQPQPVQQQQVPQATYVQQPPPQQYAPPPPQQQQYAPPPQQQQMGQPVYVQPAQQPQPVYVQQVQQQPQPVYVQQPAPIVIQSTRYERYPGGGGMGCGGIGAAVVGGAIIGAALSGGGHHHGRHHHGHHGHGGSIFGGHGHHHHGGHHGSIFDGGGHHHHGGGHHHHGGGW